MANAKANFAIFAQLEKDSCAAASAKPTVPGGKPYVPRATKPVETTSQSSSASPHTSLKPTTHSTDGSASPQSAKLKPACCSTKPFGTASAKPTESSTAKTGEKPPWAQQLKSTTPSSPAGTAGSPQLTKSTPKPAWSKPSPAATSSAETRSVGDNPFRKPLKSSTGSPNVTVASASSEAKIAFGGRLKSVTPRSVEAAKSTDSSEDAENISPSTVAANHDASNELKVPDASDDADLTSGRGSDSMKKIPRQRKPSNKLPGGTGGAALSPRAQRSSPGLVSSTTNDDAETREQEPGAAVETEKNGNDDEVSTHEERPSKEDHEVRVNGKKDACDSENFSATNTAKKQISSPPPPSLPKRQPGNVSEIKFSAPPAIPAARSNLSNSSSPAGLPGKQPLAAPPASTLADIVTDRQGRRYRRLPAPKANFGKPPRKQVKPPVVELSQCKTATGLDGIGRNNGDITAAAQEAGPVDDDELYTDATSSTPSKQPTALIGGQYVTALTRGGGASKPGPEVGVAGGQDDGEIYEEL